MKKIILFFILNLFFNLAHAATSNTYQLSDPQQQTQFNYLIQQFRCLVCQNETLADSNAPLAQDLRNQIAVLVKQKQSNDQITHYLTQRYGDFVLFNPPLKNNTYLLWLLPFILVFGGLFITVIVLKKRKVLVKDKLTPAQQQQLNQ
jgi:cytochrome c-type biogenesis protein CcmH